MPLLKTAVSGSASVGGGASANRAQGTSQAGPGGWHPTVMYMLALIIAEIIVVGWLSRTLLR